MSNISKVRKMANAMADHLRLHDEFRDIPEWAGLTWIMSPYYYRGAYKVIQIMPFEWTRRAKRLVAALDIAYRHKQDSACYSR